MPAPTHPKPDLYDVIAVVIDTGAKRLLDSRKTKENAEAVMQMAIARRGLAYECYEVVPHGSFVAPSLTKAQEALARAERIHGISRHEMETARQYFRDHGGREALEDYQQAQVFFKNATDSLEAARAALAPATPEQPTKD